MRNDISGLLEFIGADRVWRAGLQDVLAEHLAPALEAFDLDDLDDLVGGPMSGTLWGCGFEDFLGRRHGPKGANVVDGYLARHGRRETAANRAYFAALRDTPVSLHEVSDVRPGVSMVLRDVLTGAGPVTVREQSATRTLKQWDRIAVRVVPEGDHHVMSGAVLAFSPDAVALLTDGLRTALGLAQGAALRPEAAQLRDCAPVFTDAWLFAELPRLLDPPAPDVSNSDGDPVMFHELRFPLVRGATQRDVAARLDAVKALHPEGRRFWNWLAPKRRGGPARGGGLQLETQMAGRTVLGTLELKGRALWASVNSAPRAAQIEALIGDAAGALLKSPLTEIRTVAQAMAQDRRESLGGDEIGTVAQAMPQDRRESLGGDEIGTVAQAMAQDRREPLGGDEIGTVAQAMAQDRREPLGGDEIGTVAQAMAQDRREPPGGDEVGTVAEAMAQDRPEPPGDDGIPPEVARQLVHAHLDSHYRAALDAPLPVLGGKSPRKAARTAAGRADVVDWLKYLENNSARHGDDPIGTYDFAWMWAELGLSDHRK